MIIQSSGLSVRVVKEALFVLIHHSLVFFDALPLYRLDLNAVLSRLAFGRMTAWVAQEVSEGAADFLLEVMAAGRVQRVDQAAEEHVKVLLECGALERIEVPTAAIEEEEEVKAKRSKPATKATGFLRVRVKEFASFVLIQERLSQLARLRLNESAAIVLSVIFRYFSVAPFTTMQLAAKLPKGFELPLDGAEAARQGPLQQYLMILASHFDFLRVETGSVRFDMRRAVRFCRLSLLEAFIKTRLGQPSLRLFRILLAKKMVEERQLAKLSMLTSKEVRERLYQLLRVGLVQLQEVPKSADHTPSRTIFLWTVPEAANYAAPASSAIFATAASKHAHALINLRDLTHLERRRHAQLLAKVERTDVANNLDLLGDAEKKQLLSLKKTLQVLQLKADEVLQDFCILSK